MTGRGIAVARGTSGKGYRTRRALLRAEKRRRRAEAAALEQHAASRSSR